MQMKLVSSIVTLVALVFLFIPLKMIFRSLSIKNSGIEVEGVVLGKRTNSKSGLSQVTVSFTTLEGKTVSATSSKHEHVRAGDKARVWYDPASPQAIDFGDTIGYNMRGVISGGIFFAFGLFLFIRYTYKDMANTKLQRSGRKISAELVSIDRNERYRMGDKNPWVIRCRWINDRNNQEYQFLSKDYIVDPNLYLKGISHIDVFIDPMDASKYYMDTSFMPKGNNTIG